MCASPAQSRIAKTSGLRYWMLRVLEECDNVAADFAADSVHDLRVSLRRCRSLADGLMALDPDLNWKTMKKAGRRLFQRLGALRDIQVMIEWVEKLSANQAGRSLLPSWESPNGKPNETAIGAMSKQDVDLVPQALLRILRAREKEQKLEAQHALEEFDRKQWRQWSKSLPARAARFRPGNSLFKHLALERWTEARALHTRALRNRSQTSFHTLRIGIKRFRYIVENFLPTEHKAWNNDLKEMQDLLGEVHDLDVLWHTAVSARVFPDAASRQRWHKQIVAERTRRVQRYRQKMVGPEALWNVWRAALPQGRQVQALALRRIKLWASALDPDFAHSERVAQLALQLYDGLLASGWEPASDGASPRTSVFIAALLHDVGKSKRHKDHQKISYELIRAHAIPLGWNAADLRRAATIARFHRGTLPTRKHSALRDLLPIDQKSAIQLAAILRLANALDAAHDGQIRRVQVETGQNRFGMRAAAHKLHSNGFVKRHAFLAANQPLVIVAEGYSPFSASAQTIAAERHLLETVLRRPVVVKPMNMPPRSRRVAASSGDHK